MITEQDAIKVSASWFCVGMFVGAVVGVMLTIFILTLAGEIQ